MWDGHTSMAKESGQTRDCLQSYTKAPRTKVNSAPYLTSGCCILRAWECAGIDDELWSCSGELPLWDIKDPSSCSATVTGGEKEFLWIQAVPYTGSVALRNVVTRRPLACLVPRCMMAWA